MQCGHLELRFVLYHVARASSCSLRCRSPSVAACVGHASCPPLAYGCTRSWELQAALRPAQAEAASRQLLQQGKENNTHWSQEAATQVVVVTGGTKGVDAREPGGC